MTRTMYHVMAESAEGYRLVSSTAGTYWERVWRPFTMCVEETPEAAHAAAARLEGGRSSQVRNVHIVEVEVPSA